MGTALHCLPLSCPRSDPRISPSTHTTIRIGRFGQIFGEMFGSRRKKPDFFNPFPKKIQGIHTKTLNCGGVYGKLIVSKEPLNKSSAALSGSFAPTYRFENLEIHKVFLRFPNLNLETKSLADHSCDLIRGSLIIPVCRGAELSRLWGVARRRSVRWEGRGQRRARPLFQGV